MEIWRIPEIPADGLVTILISTFSCLVEWMPESWTYLPVQFH